MRAPVLVLATLLLVPTATASLVGGLLGPPPQPADVIVGHQTGERDAVSALLGSLGATVGRADADLSFVTARVPSLPLAMAALTASPLVTFVETDHATAMTGAEWNGAEWNGAEWNGAEWNGAEWNGIAGAPAEPGLGFQWGLMAIHAPLAWKTTTGSDGATLCVLDSGVDATHPDLAPNMWSDATGAHGWNFVANNADTSDDGGHGTHMAGIAAASIGNAWGVAGVGNERIMSVKVLDGSGHGKESDLASGIAWCALHGAKVALMALSVTDWGPALEGAVAFAAKRDVLLVGSAGNAGPCTDCVAYPARDARVLAVSAIDAAGKPASFSSQGAQVDIAAPGVKILSTFPGDRFVYGSGTSQAAAFAAGVAALARDRAPSLSADATRTLLTSTTASGARLDAGAALQRLG